MAMANQPAIFASAIEGKKIEELAPEPEPESTKSHEANGGGRDYLTSLPVELKELVFEELNLLDKLNLRCSNKFFMTYIPGFTHDDYLEAETLAPAKGHFYACNTCCRLRPRVKFADNARVKEKGPGAKKAKNRYCLDCGLEENQDGLPRLRRNTWVTIDKEPWIVCSQCGLLGKAHKGHGTLFCADCWRLDVQPRLEAHANPPIPDPETVQEQRTIGDTWVSNYTTPHDVVQSAILTGISAPNSFAKHKKWDMNGEEITVNGGYHAEEKDLGFEKPPSWVHLKLINGKNSKQQYRLRYRQPIMTRSAICGAPAATDSSNPERFSSTAVANPARSVVTIDSTNDGYGIAGPGPSTLGNAANKTDLAPDLDSAINIDASAAASFPTQGGVHAAAKLTTAISATQPGASERSEAKDLANVPMWAQKASQNAHAPLWSTNQDKAAQHVPACVWKGTTEEGPSKQPDLKAPGYIPSNTPETTDFSGLAVDVDYTKEIRVFAQPRYSVHIDMDMKPPCAPKVDLKARSYSRKTAPQACSVQGNSGNIIGMNYIKARRAFYQRDPDQKVGWHTVWTVEPTTSADLDNVSSKTLASIQAESDNPKEHKARSPSPREVPVDQDRSYVDKCQKRCRIEEDSEEEWSGFSDCSGTSTPEPVGGSTLEEWRAKAVACINKLEKPMAIADPEAAGSKSAFAYFNNPLVRNLEKKPRLDEDSDDSFEGFSDSDSSWEGIDH